MKRLTSVLFLAAASAAAQPTITNGGVYNAASYIPFHLPNGGVAPGSLFVMFGTGLGPANLVQGSYPLSTTLGGTSVSVAIGGVAPVSCLMIYTSDKQVAAVLPSRVAAMVPNGGNGTITVSYNGRTSQPRLIRVLPNAFGMLTLNQAGSGPAVLYNFNSESDQPVNTLAQPAKPGQAVTLWGTGLGPVAGDEAAGPLPGALRLNLQLYVGNIAVTPDYAGRSGCCAGVDQIAFRVPQGVEGCYVPIIVVLNGMAGNIGTMSISSDGQACSDQTFSSADIATAQSNGSLRMGALIFNSTLATNGTQQIRGGAVAAGFMSVSFDQLIRSASPSLPPAGCYIGGATPAVAPAVQPIDAGAVLSLRGPGVPRTLPLLQVGDYGMQFNNEMLDAGTYVLENGGGSAALGSFSASINLPGPLNWTDESSIGNIDIHQPLTVHWNGADPNGRVVIIGAAVNASPNQTVSFACTAPASAGAFTVPPFILETLPTTMSGINGYVAVQVYGAGRFSAPGLDAGTIMYTTGHAKAVEWKDGDKRPVKR